MAKHTIVLIPGDGIGPEVTHAAQRVVNAAAATYAIYTDGILDSLSTNNAGFEQAVKQGGVVTFGATVDSYSGDGTVAFNGSLDEIQIYNRPLTTAQVQRLFTSNSPNAAASTSILPSNSNVSIAANATLDLNGVSQQIGSLTGTPGSAITLGTGQLTVNSPANTTFAGAISGAGGLTKQGIGTLTLSGANSYAGTTSISAGTLIAAHPSALGEGPVGIHSGALLQLQPGLTSAVKIPSLTFDGSTDNYAGSLDLTNDKLIVEDSLTHATSLATLQSQSHSVITSATMPANFGIAVLDNAVTNFNTFGNISVDANSILLSPELLGDTNADGSVDLNDLNAVLNNLGQTTLAWTSGNFDGAATIDLNDLNEVLNNLGTTDTPSLSQLPMTNYQSPSPASTPEPATAALLVLAAPLLLKRRR